MLKSIFAAVVFLSAFSFSLSAQVNPNSILPAKTAGTVTLKAPTGVAAQSNGLKTSPILVSIDTTIRSNPKNPMKPDSTIAYLSIDFVNLTGTNYAEITAGRQLYWIFDKTGKQVMLPNQVLKIIKTTAENATQVEMIVKVPYRLRKDKNLYTIHYRWESVDKTKNIDILTTK